MNCREASEFSLSKLKVDENIKKLLKGVDKEYILFLIRNRNGSAYVEFENLIRSKIEANDHLPLVPLQTREICTDLYQAALRADFVREDYLAFGHITKEFHSLLADASENPWENEREDTPIEQGWNKRYSLEYKRELGVIDHVYHKSIMFKADSGFSVDLRNDQYEEMNYEKIEEDLKLLLSEILSLAQYQYVAGPSVKFYARCEAIDLRRAACKNVVVNADKIRTFYVEHLLFLLE